MIWQPLKCNLSDYHNSYTVLTLCSCWVMTTVWKVTGVQQLDNITAWSLWQHSRDCILLSYSVIQVGCLSRLLMWKHCFFEHFKWNVHPANVIVILIVVFIKWWRADGSSKWTLCNPKQTKIKSPKDYQSSPALHYRVAAQHNILCLTRSIMLK